MFRSWHLHLVVLVLLAASGRLGGEEPVERLLALDAKGDGDAINYAELPAVSGKLVVVRRANSGGVPAPEASALARYEALKFQLHSYLVHHRGRFWCAWSEGPPVEDEPTQEMRYATSLDGITWSDSESVTGRPEAPYAWIARGLWIRDGELLALAAHFKGKGAFGVDKELELRAFGWDENAARWKPRGKIYDDAINNFPPQQLVSGEWLMTRRDSRFNVSMLLGGEKLGSWDAYPVVRRDELPRFRPDEPLVWQQADRSLVALFRDNGGSQRLFHATSGDGGRTWTKPTLTNFPNATSKIFSLAVSRGYRILLANANPSVGRRQLYLAISEDGRRFVRLARLDIPAPPGEIPREAATRFAAGVATLQYPHAIEHAGSIWITFSRNKKQTEVMQVPLDAIDALRGSGETTTGRLGQGDR